ncbi:putative transmembrane protein [Toxoplasma gondii MAS]|uniref:Putative transmembrane protein n=1 Tax=Toxoplasma gondii MAS TaxID=943118 RepID=A0A086Q7F2_TOXGO|nr:putative transmembrane protein [Toxoplasma gondii MAS]
MASWLSAKISALGERVMDSVLDAVVQNQDLHLKNLQNMQQWNISRLVNRVVSAKYFYKQQNVESCAEFDELFPSPDSLLRCSPSSPPPPKPTSFASSFLVPQEPLGHLDIRVRSCSLVLFTAENGRVLPSVAMLQRQHQQLLWQTVIHVENQEQRSPCYKMEKKDAYATNEILFDDSFEFPIRDLWTDICIDVVALKTKRHIIVKPASSSAANSPAPNSAVPGSCCKHSHPSSRSPAVPSERAASTGGFTALGASGAGDTRVGSADGDADSPEGSRGAEEGLCVLESPRTGATSRSPGPDVEHLGAGPPSASSPNHANSPRARTGSSSSASSSREGRYLYGRAILPLSAFLSSSPPQLETRKDLAGRKRESSFWRGFAGMDSKEAKAHRRRNPVAGDGEEGESGRGKKREEDSSFEPCRVSRAEFWVQLFPDNHKLSERKYLRPVKGFEEFGMKNPLSTLGFLHVTVAFEWTRRPSISPLLSCLLPPSQLWVVPLKPEPHYVESFSQRCKDAFSEPPRWIDLFFHFGGHLEDRTWAGSCCWLLFWLNLLYGTCFAPFYQLPGCAFVAVALVSFAYFLLRQNRFFVYSLPPFGSPTLPVAAPPLSFHTPMWAAPTSPLLPFFPAPASLSTSAGAPPHLLPSLGSDPVTAAASRSVEMPGPRQETPGEPSSSTPSFRHRQSREKGSNPLSAPLGDCGEKSDLDDFSDDLSDEDTGALTGHAASRRGSAALSETKGATEERRRRGTIDATNRRPDDGDCVNARGEEAFGLGTEGRSAVEETELRHESSLGTAASTAEAALATLGFPSFGSSSFSAVAKVDGRKEDGQTEGQSIGWPGSSEDPKKEKPDVFALLSSGAPASVAFTLDGEEAVRAASVHEQGEESNLLHPRRGRVSKVSSPFGDITLFVRESAKGEEGQGRKTDETWPIFADDETEPLVQEQLNKLIELATGLQIATGYLSSVLEKIRYAFNWADPFLSYASLCLLFFHCVLWCLLLFAASFVPLLAWRLLVFFGFLLFGVVTDPRVQARIDAKLQKEIQLRLEAEGKTEAMNSQEMARFAAQCRPALPDAGTREQNEDDACARRRSSSSSLSSLITRFPAASSSDSVSARDFRAGGEAARPGGGDVEQPSRTFEREDNSIESPSRAAGEGHSTPSLDSKDKPSTVPSGSGPNTAASGGSASWLAAFVGPSGVTPASTSSPENASSAASAATSQTPLGLTSASPSSPGGAPFWTLLDVATLIKRRGPGGSCVGGLQKAASPQSDREGDEGKSPGTSATLRAKSLGSESDVNSGSTPAFPVASLGPGLPRPSESLETFRATRITLFTYLVQEASSVCCFFGDLYASLVAFFPAVLGPPAAPCLRLLGIGAVLDFLRFTLFSPLFRLLESAVFTYFSLLHFWWARLPDRREIEHRLIASTQVISSLASLLPPVSPDQAVEKKDESSTSRAPVFAAVSPPCTSSPLFPVDQLLFSTANRIALAPPTATPLAASTRVSEFLHKYFQERWEKENPLTASVYAAAPYLLPGSQKKGPRDEAREAPVKDRESTETEGERVASKASQRETTQSKTGAQDKEEIIARAASGGYAPDVAWLASHLSSQELQRWHKEQSKRLPKHLPSLPSGPPSRLHSSDALSPSWEAREPLGGARSTGDWRQDSGREGDDFGDRATRRGDTDRRRGDAEGRRGEPDRRKGDTDRRRGETDRRRRDIMDHRQRDPDGSRGDKLEEGRESWSNSPDEGRQSHACSRSKARRSSRREREDRSGRVERFLGPVFGWGEDVAIVTRRAPVDARSSAGDSRPRREERGDSEKKKERSSLVGGLHFSDFPAFDLLFGRHKKASERDSRQARATRAADVSSLGTHACGDNMQETRRREEQANEEKRGEGEIQREENSGKQPRVFESALRRM